MIIDKSNPFSEGNFINFNYHLDYVWNEGHIFFSLIITQDRCGVTCEGVGGGAKLITPDE